MNPRGRGTTGFPAAAEPRPPHAPDPPRRPSSSLPEAPAPIHGHRPLRPQFRRRIFVAAALLAVWSALLVGRLFQLQVLQHEVMAARGRAQHQHALTIPPLRGDIRDRRGRPLAMTIARDSVYAVPPDYRDLHVPGAAARLSGCLDVPEATIARRLRRKSRFSWLKRRASEAEVACAEATGLPIGTLEEYGRFYPGGTLAAQTIGFVGTDGEGLAGIEHALDEAVRGDPGRRAVWTDGRQTSRGSRVVRESRAGADLELTLDARLQAVAEEELARGISETGATSGAVILIETDTGEILALANAPFFDPNRYRDFPPRTYRNRTITDPYEPGSVFKMFTAAAALEEGVTHEDEVFDTSGGRYPVQNRVIRDWKPLGSLTFAEVIQRSSNIGTLQTADRLGSATMRTYLDRFGFSEMSGLGLPGESRGIAPAGSRWRRIRLATVSFGQGISVTPVQLVRATNAVASGGIRVPLRLVRKIGGQPVPFEPAQRVLGARSARRVARILAGAVTRGTGGAAAVEGFEVAGKTGTAQTVVNGRYSPTRYNASFAGFWPAGAPRFSAVVILDTERPNHSGTHAARVFGRIARRVLLHYGQLPPGTEVLLPAPTPPAPISPLRVAAAGSDAGTAAAPPARDAAASLLRVRAWGASAPGPSPPGRTPEAVRIAGLPESAAAAGTPRVPDRREP